MIAPTLLGQSTSRATCQFCWDQTEPSLGGFVCPCVVIDAEIWKLGQLKAGDTVKFRRLSIAEAENLKSVQEHEIETLQQATTGPADVPNLAGGAGDEGILAELGPTGERPRVVYRAAGDSYILVEYGPPVLNLDLRFRVHALMEFVAGRELPGMIDLTPGIRSLQLHFDSRKLHLKNLLQILLEAEKELPRIDEMSVATRIVHMPLSWEDGSTLLGIQKYVQSVRADAPWCPSNLEFIRRV
jgi:urea carboxylase